MTSSNTRPDNGITHEQVLAEAASYLDGELSREESARIEAHLETCPSCRQVLATLRVTRQLVRSMPQAMVPRPFTLEQAPRRSALPALFFYLRAATGLAAAAFVALFAATATLPAATSTPGAPVLQQPRQAPAATGALERPTASQPAAGAPAATAPARAAAPTPLGAQAPKAAPADAARAAATTPPAPTRAPAVTSPTAPPPTALPAPAVTAREAEAAKRAAETDQGDSGVALLASLQAAAGVLTVSLAIATAAVWLAHRRRSP